MRDLGMRIIAGFDNWFRFLKDRRNLDNGFQLPLRNFNFLLPNCRFSVCGRFCEFEGCKNYIL